MNINIETWHAKRKLDFCPKHFVKCRTKLTENSELWILEKCKGRYYIQSNSLDFHNLVSLLDPDSERSIPYFEDPQEAVLYELTWS